MKSRARALLDKSIGAMISAIEVYNKPSFRYREGTFSALAINVWELLLKAKWLKEHGNNVKSLYAMEYKNKKDGQPSRVATPGLTASDNPFTVPIRHLAIKLEEKKFLTPPARANGAVRYATIHARGADQPGARECAIIRHPQPGRHENDDRQTRS